MLSPGYLERVPNTLVSLWSDVELDILRNMAERIAAYDIYIPAAQHQNQMLQEMGRSYNEISQRLSKILGKSEQELERLLLDAGGAALRSDNAIYKRAGLTPVALSSSPAMQKVIVAGLQQTNGAFTNLTKTTASAASSQYVQALDLAYLQINSGAFDYNTAIKNAIKSLSDKGLEAIHYPSGKKEYVDVAVRRATITGVNQTALRLQLTNADEVGAELVEVTAHSGARPSHAEWQGSICRLQYDGPGKYPYFYDYTGYGSGEGLGGWNCNHSFFPYFEGMPKAYTQEMLDEYNAPNVEYNGKMLTEYEAMQVQRYHERQIRKYKREFTATEAAGLPAGQPAAKLSQWQARQKDFLEQTGLKAQAARTQIPGFGRSQAAKANNAAKALASRAKTGILKTTGTFADRFESVPGMTPKYLSAISERFEQGTDTAKAVFQQLVKPNSIGSGTSTSAYYSPRSQQVFLNFADDLVNPRGPGTTFFHEHGHYVDRARGLSKGESFAAALKADYEAKIKATMKALGTRKRTEAYAEISKELLGPKTSAVSDLFGGLSKNKCVGSYGHWSTTYWKREGAVPVEAFAHMFEAQFDSVRYETLKRYFPTALAEFEAILKGVV